MKIKFLLISILLIIFNGCGDKVEYTKIAIGDVVKISSDYSSYDKADIIFAWSPPISNNGSIPEFEIDNNVLYFSPDTIEKYSMKLTIESMSGNPIVEEEFYYEGVSTLADSEKNYNNTNFPSAPLAPSVPSTQLETPIKTENNKKLNYFTVQVYARTVKEEAGMDLSGLNALGFEDVFIEEFRKDGTNYWRVRSGKFNSIKKAEKRKNDLSKVLKIDIRDLWAVEVK